MSADPNLENAVRRRRAKLREALSGDAVPPVHPRRGLTRTRGQTAIPTTDALRGLDEEVASGSFNTGAAFASFRSHAAGASTMSHTRGGEGGARTSARASVLERKATAHGADQLVVSGPREGDILSRDKVPHGSASIAATRENMEQYMEASRAQKFSAAVNQTHKYGTPTSQEYRLSLNSDARDNVANTTTSDWVVTLPDGMDIPDVSAAELVGYQLPVSRYTIEKEDSRIPVRFGRHAAPGSRALSVTISAVEREDGETMVLAPQGHSSAHPRTLTAELPLTCNPIAAISPVEVGSTRGLRIRTVFRVGSSLNVLAHGWDGAEVGDGTFVSLAGLPGVPGVEGTDTWPVDVSSITTIAPDGTTSPEYDAAGHSKPPSEEEPLVNVAGSGASAMPPLDALDLEDTRSYEDVEDVVLGTANELVVLDDNLFKATYGDVGVTEDLPVITCDAYRAGLPLGFLMTPPADTMSDLCNRLSTAATMILHPYGASARVSCSPDTSWTTHVSISWSRFSRSLVSDTRKEGPRAKCPVLAFQFDGLGTSHLGFSGILSSRDGEIHADAILFAASAPPTISEDRETAALAVGDVSDTVSLQEVVQTGFEGSLYTPRGASIGGEIPAEFDIPVQARGINEGAVQWVSVPSGRYVSPHQLASAIQVALRAAFPSLDFEADPIFVEEGGVRFGGVAFSASRVFSLRFDLSVNGSRDATALQPTWLGYEPRAHSGRPRYFPSLVDEEPTRARSAPGALQANGFPEPWPSRVHVHAPSSGLSSRLTFKTEAHPPVQHVIKERSYTSANAAVLRTPIAHGLPSWHALSLVPTAWASSLSDVAAELKNRIGNKEDGTLGGSLLSKKAGLGSGSDALSMKNIIDNVFEHAKIVRDIYEERGPTLSNEEDIHDVIEASVGLGSEITSHTVASLMDVSFDGVDLVLEVVRRARMIVLRIVPGYATIVGRSVPIASTVSNCPIEAKVADEGAVVEFGFTGGMVHALDADGPEHGEDGDVAFDGSEARTLVVVITSSAFRTYDASPDAVRESDLGIGTAQIVLKGSTEFTAEPAPTDTLSIDLASRCYDRIQSQSLGMIPDEYAARGDRLITSERSITLTHPSQIELHVELNPQTQATSRSDVDMLQKRGQRPAGGVGNRGTIMVVDSTDDAYHGTYSKRCMAVVPLGRRGVVRGEDRVSVNYGAPQRVNTIRVTVTQPDGTLYPFHGAPTSVHLLLTTHDIRHADV